MVTVLMQAPSADLVGLWHAEGWHSASVIWSKWFIKIEEMPHEHNEHSGCWGSCACKVSDYWLDTRGLIPSRARYFSHHHNAQTSSWPCWTIVQLLPGPLHCGCMQYEANHPPPPCVEVNSVWSVTLFPHPGHFISMVLKHRYNLLFLPYTLYTDDLWAQWGVKVLP
jgi:hypothetical protein